VQRVAVTLALGTEVLTAARMLTRPAPLGVRQGVYRSGEIPQ
jgi:hypothetical protein